MLPSNQGDIKNVALEPGRHQICNPLDFFDLRCESVTYLCNPLIQDNTVSNKFNTDQHLQFTESTN